MVGTAYPTLSHWFCKLEFGLLRTGELAYGKHSWAKSEEGRWLKRIALVVARGAYSNTEHLPVEQGHSPVLATDFPRVDGAAMMQELIRRGEVASNMRRLV